MVGILNPSPEFFTRVPYSPKTKLFWEMVLSAGAVFPDLEFISIQNAHDYEAELPESFKHFNITPFYAGVKAEELLWFLGCCERFIKECEDKFKDLPKAVGREHHELNMEIPFVTLILLAKLEYADRYALIKRRTFRSQQGRIETILLQLFLFTKKIFALFGFAGQCEFPKQERGHEWVDNWYNASVLLYDLLVRIVKTPGKLREEKRLFSKQEPMDFKPDIVQLPSWVDNNTFFACFYLVAEQSLLRNGYVSTLVLRILERIPVAMLSAVEHDDHLKTLEQSLDLPNLKPAPKKAKRKVKKLIAIEPSDESSSSGDDSNGESSGGESKAEVASCVGPTRAKPRRSREKKLSAKQLNELLEYARSVKAKNKGPEREENLLEIAVELRNRLETHCQDGLKDCMAADSREELTKIRTFFASDKGKQWANERGITKLSAPKRNNFEKWWDNSENQRKYKYKSLAYSGNPAWHILKEQRIKRINFFRKAAYLLECGKQLLTAVKAGPRSDRLKVRILSEMSKLDRINELLVGARTDLKLSIEQRRLERTWTPTGRIPSRDEIRERYGFTERDYLEALEGSGGHGGDLFSAAGVGGAEVPGGTPRAKHLGSRRRRKKKGKTIPKPLSTDVHDDTYQDAAVDAILDRSAFTNVELHKNKFYLEASLWLTAMLSPLFKEGKIPSGLLVYDAVFNQMHTENKCIFVDLSCKPDSFKRSDGRGVKNVMEYCVAYYDSSHFLGDGGRGVLTQHTYAGKLICITMLEPNTEGFMPGAEYNNDQWNLKFSSEAVEYRARNLAAFMSGLDYTGDDIDSDTGEAEGKAGPYIGPGVRDGDKSATAFMHKLMNKPQEEAKEDEKDVDRASGVLVAQDRGTTYLESLMRSDSSGGEVASASRTPL